MRFKPPAPAPDGRISIDTAFHSQFDLAYTGTEIIGGPGTLTYASPSDREPFIVLTGRDGHGVYSGEITPLSENILGYVMAASNSMRAPSTISPTYPSPTSSPSTRTTSLALPETYRDTP